MALKPLEIKINVRKQLKMAFFMVAVISIKMGIPNGLSRKH
jgi:hypothetical protein